MLTIQKKTIRKSLTLEEFMKVKKEPPFDEYRQMAKLINFGFLFGLVAVSFSNKTLETTWTEEQADRYIKENNLRALKEKIINKFPGDTPKQWKYITCATDIRSKFFRIYPGLMERITRERDFGAEHGYVRSWHGACRRLAELFFMEKDDNGNLKYLSDDNKLYRKQISTLLNVAANATIQNFEASVVMTSIVRIQRWLEETNKNSYIWGSVHDSIDLMIYKDEKEEVLQKVYDICVEDITNMFQGMPLDVEIVVANLLKGEIYKGGTEWIPKKQR